MKIPLSPFTTRLSGSAKEAELRLRNIFQWKKKRPPVVLFVLVAALVLLCCSLVSCQTQGEEPPADTVEVDWNNSYTQTPSADPVETVRSQLEYERTKDYTFHLQIYDIYADEEETQRLADMYRGGELAQSRGWKDEWFDDRFVVICAEYYVRYDHTKTFLDDGEVYKNFYLMQNPEDDLWYIVDGYGPIGKRNSLRLPDGEYSMLLPVGEEISVDLDGDGTPETILVGIEQGEYDIRYTLSINRVDCMDTLAQLGIYFDSPQEYFAITDLDTGDGLLEIALPDYGPSADPHTIFLRYDGANLSSLGEVYGMVSDGDLSFDGAGVISSYMRLSVLQTWFAPVQWSLDETGVFRDIPQELYYPRTPAPPVTALQELAAYTEPDTDSQRTALPAGTQLSLLATDNARWVQCANKDGNQFWLHLDEESFHSVELYNGSYSWNALDGLIMAD